VIILQRSVLVNGTGWYVLCWLPVVPAVGLVELVNRCLAFSASDRPEFREVLTLLEGEYRALRARQPPRSQRDHQPPLPQQVHSGTATRDREGGRGRDRLCCCNTGWPFPQNCRILDVECEERT
jgi:hypothetical protein